MSKVEDYNPRRIMPSGEMVYQALDRLRRHSRELRLQAMSQVKQLTSGPRYMKLFHRLKRKPTKEEMSVPQLSQEEAEDEVYCRRFGPSRFPDLKSVARDVPSLEERLRTGT